MNAASLQMPATVPVAAAPPFAATASGGGAGTSAVGGGGITPAAGQGFVPATAGAASGQAGAAPADPSGQAAAPAGDGSLPAEQALKAIMQVLGAEYGQPIIAADGSVYMEKKKPDVKDGKLALSYMLVGKIDKATGRMKVNPAIVEQAKAKADGGAPKKLVKVDDQYVWQTFSKTEDGKTIAEVTPATEAELQAYQAQMQAQQAQQAQEAKTQNRGDWQQKVGVVAQNLGLFGSAGQLVAGLSGGPNPYTGRPGASWLSGWILAQRLNGKAEGKLLPPWLQTGWVATALEWGMQGYGMLDFGNDIKTVSNFLKHAPPLPNVNPTAVQDLIKQGQHPAMAQALGQLGSELRTNGLQMVEGTGNAAVLNTKAGALQLVPKDSLHTAFAATDPIQNAGLKLRGQIDGGAAKGLGMLKGLIQPAMMGATALGLVSSAITVKNLVEKNGAKVLLNSQQGRGALLGALSSAAFLGMYLIPMVLPGLGVAGAALGAASSMANIASNVMGGVQMLNSYGLFGKAEGTKGFLDNDAVRAAFLIPPLSPIGAFAFYMKKRKQKAAAEQAKLEAAQKLAVERIQQQREMAKLQLQSGGQIAGATSGADGAISVTTGVPNDLSQLAAQLGGAAPSAAAGSSGAAPASAAAPAGASALDQQRQQLTMTAKPMR